MKNRVMKPIATTLMLATAIFTFGCKKPLHGEGVHMGEKPPVTVEAKKDAHQEEVLKATPKPVNKPATPKMILKGEGTNLIVEPKNPFKGSR